MATLGYHVLTDEWLTIPWDCSYPGRLTIAESRNVLKTHEAHGKTCRIRRTAKRVLARLIDAPTVRAQAVAAPVLTLNPALGRCPKCGRAGGTHYVIHDSRSNQQER